MRHLMLIAAALALVALSACASSGAGQTQDPCGLAKASAVSPGGTSQAAAAQATGGQRASNQPQMQDPAKWSPATTWNGGSGATNSTNQWWEDRAQAGAPSVNQGLVLPTKAEASNDAGAGVSPVVATLQDTIFDTREQLHVALAKGDTETANALREDLANQLSLLAQVSNQAKPTITNNYDLQGAYIYQQVANSSTGNGGAGKSKIDEGSAESGGDPAAKILESFPPPVPAAPEAPADAGGSPDGGK